MTPPGMPFWPGPEALLLSPAGFRGKVEIVIHDGRGNRAKESGDAKIQQVGTGAGTGNIQ
jgi:hypothetical protein